MQTQNGKEEPPENRGKRCVEKKIKIGDWDRGGIRSGNKRSKQVEVNEKQGWNTDEGGGGGQERKKVVVEGKHWKDKKRKGGKEKKSWNKNDDKMWERMALQVIEGRRRKEMLEREQVKILLLIYLMKLVLPSFPFPVFFFLFSCHFSQLQMKNCCAIKNPNLDMLIFSFLLCFTNHL